MILKNNAYVIFEVIKSLLGKLTICRYKRKFLWQIQILILGNGFDRAMNRDTRYTDFIEFEKQLFSNPDEELLQFLKVKNISIEKYKDNLYLKFINENKDTLGEKLV